MTHSAEKDAGVRGVYLSIDTLREWREDAEQRANRADSHLVFAARIVALINALEAPCGSCHPCDHYAAETWRQAGGKIPHKVFVDEWREKAQNCTCGSPTEAASQGLAVAEGLLRKVVDYWDGRPTTHHGDHIYADLLEVLKAITPSTEVARHPEAHQPPLAAPRGDHERP